MKCRRCDTGVLGKPHWQEVTGFVQHRQQGGSNYVALKKPTGNFLCEACMVLEKSGIKKGNEPLPGQTSFVCQCGNPTAEGVVHRAALPCYHE